MRRSKEVEAPRSVGELDMLVMKYVRRTCERGKRAKGAIGSFSADMDEDEEPLEMEGDRLAGRSLGCEVCILRPCCIGDAEIFGVFRFCNTLKSVASVCGDRNAGFIVARKL